MNMSETTALIRFIAAACPAQKFDEYTADAWATALEDVDAGDAKIATIKLVREKPFIACSDIVTGIKHLRRKRLEAFGDIGSAPREILDDPRAWQKWERERREGILSGRITKENDTHPPELMPSERPYPTAGGAWWTN